MDGFKKIVLKRQNTEKSSYFNDRATQETGTQLFSTWNNIESYEEDSLGKSKLRTSQSFFLDDEEEDIPAIPDIEDLRDQDFIQQPAEAPSLEINRIDKLEELDKNARKIPFLSTSDNIDLSVFSDICLPEDKIRENDVPWTWDSIITDVMYHVDVINLGATTDEADEK